MSKPFMQSDILSTSIGIYYRTIEWLNQFIIILLDGIPPEAIVRRTKNEIVLVGGIIIRFCPAVENMRGHKFNKVFMQENIPMEFFYRVISPTTIYGYRNVFVVDDNLKTIQKIELYACSRETKEKENNKE